MADLIETTAAVVAGDWAAGIYQLEQEDLVLGGADGIDNLQAKQLLARINYLKAELVGLGVSAFIRTLLDDIDAATARATLGAVTQADIDTAIASLVAASPAALDTLNELAAALGNDANFATTITNALALKAPLDGPAFTGTPTAPTPPQSDRSNALATTEFVRTVIDGGDYKASVRATTTANLAAPSGLLTIDGVVLAAGDRVLVKDQAAGAENGIYVAAAGAWARAEDANSAGDLTSGVLVPVEEGTTNADTVWMLTSDGDITIGATVLAWQIQRSVGLETNGMVSYVASTTLGQAALGKMIYVNSAVAETLTLPDIPPAGEVVAISNIIGAGTWTIAAAGAAVIFANGQNSMTSIALAPGESVVLVSSGVDWVQISHSSPSIGPSQTIQNLTASRAIGTTYYNTSNRPIEVSVSGGMTSGNGLQLIINGVSAGRFSGNSATEVYGSVSGIVNPGEPYSVTYFSGSTVLSFLWTERR